MPDPHQQPGGFPVEYQAKRPRFDPTSSEGGLNSLIYDWVSERRIAIKDIRDHGERISQGMLDSASARMSERWVLTSVGNSAAAWIERACTFSAMLLDFRSRQFGRRVLSEQTDERGDLDCHLDLMRLSHDDFKPLSSREHQQALASRVFSRQWLRYLGRLLIHPPGSPLPLGNPFHHATITQMIWSVEWSPSSRTVAHAARSTSFTALTSGGWPEDVPCAESRCIVPIAMPDQLLAS